MTQILVRFINCPEKERSLSKRNSRKNRRRSRMKVRKITAKKLRVRQPLRLSKITGLGRKSTML